MKHKFAVFFATILLIFSLTGCSDEIAIKQPDIKVDNRNSNTTTYIYFRNGYKFSDVDIVRNEDDTITITITAIPPEKFYCD